MAKHKWKFKAHFRSGAYSWKGTALASKRMKEAISEIKKVARTDSALAGEGAIELMCQLYPACEHIDSSSGSLGAALNKTVAALIPIVTKADWDMNTRGRLLEDLYEAVCNDGWSILSEVEDCWGEICVYPGLANLWADRLVPFLRDIWSSESSGYVTGDGICLSCLLYTQRYDELRELIALNRFKLWSNSKFWAQALVKQGKIDDAIVYAESIRDFHEGKYDNARIDDFCEKTLLEAGRADEAYDKYGLRVVESGTYVSVYRSIVAKYPHRDKREILLDLMETSGEKVKWFAAAKDAGFLDIALDCARTGQAKPVTLLRATRDFADKEPDFAVEVGIESIRSLFSGASYELPTGADVAAHYDVLMGVAAKHGLKEKAKAELSQVALRHGASSDPPPISSRGPCTQATAGLVGRAWHDRRCRVSGEASDCHPWTYVRSVSLSPRWHRSASESNFDLSSHGRRHRMQKRLILRLSLISLCMCWTESSLTFSAGGLHVGLVHDLLRCCQHRRFGLREEADSRVPYTYREISRDPTTDTYRRTWGIQLRLVSA